MPRGAHLYIKGWLPFHINVAVTANEMRAGLSVSVCRHWHQTLCKPLQSEMMSWSVPICALRAVPFHRYTHLLHALVTSVTPRVFIVEDSAKMMNSTCPLFTSQFERPSFVEKQGAGYVYQTSGTKQCDLQKCY